MSDLVFLVDGLHKASVPDPVHNFNEQRFWVEPSGFTLGASESRLYFLQVGSIK